MITRSFEDMYGFKLEYNPALMSYYLYLDIEIASETIELLSQFKKSDLGIEYMILEAICKNKTIKQFFDSKNEQIANLKHENVKLKADIEALKQAMRILK